MKIYLAGPCDTENRTIMVEAAKYIRTVWKEEVYCPWELKIEDAWNYSQEDWAQMVFDKDVEAINNCDTFIMISVGRKSTAGTNWEQGYAYALKKPIYVIQITEEPTSLMTFCACDGFFNAHKRNMENVLSAILKERYDGFDTDRVWADKAHCKTILT